MSVSGSRSITLNTALTPSISWSTKNVIVESISLETEIVTPWWQIHSILPFAVDTSEFVLGDGIGTFPCVWSSTAALRVRILQIVHLTNRPYKWRQHVQNSSGTKSHRRVVSLQSFNILTSFQLSIRVQTMDSCCRLFDLDGFEVVVFRKNARARKRNTKLHDHDVIVIVCTHIYHSSLTSLRG